MYKRQTPYREAVLALAERQLVHIRPKKGTYVSHIDLKLVEEVRHLRSIVETELAVMACDLLTEEDLAELAVSAKGGKKNVLPEMDFYIVLNKADDEKRLKMAERIALRVERDSGEKVRITSFR